MPISFVRRHSDLTGASETESKTLYCIPSSEFNAYPKQIKVLLSVVKKYRIFIPRPKGSGDIAMNQASVRPPVSCPLYNLKTIWNILMILHSYVEQVVTIVAYKNESLLFNISCIIFPFDAFLCIFVSAL